MVRKSFGRVPNSVSFVGTIFGIATYILSFSGVSSAQEYPAKTVEIIVPFAAGGTIDVMTRVIADEMSKSLGQSIVIANVPGAGSMLGTDALRRSEADGYTLGTSTVALASLPVQYKAFTSDPIEDFTHICEFAAGPLVVLVNSSFPADDFSQFIGYVKSNPGRVKYAAHSAHVELELGYLAEQAGLNMLKVPYTGGPQATAALLSDEVQVMLLGLTSSQSFIESGDMKALGTTSLKPFSNLTDIPAIADSGLPGYAGSMSWSGLMGPKGLPIEVVEKLSAACRDAMGATTVTEALATFGMAASAAGPEAVQDLIASDTSLFVKQAAAVGLVAQ